MTIDLDGMPDREPSSLVGFSGNNLVRDAENRDGESLAKALAHPDVQVEAITTVTGTQIEADNGGTVHLRGTGLALVGTVSATSGTLRLVK